MRNYCIWGTNIIGRVEYKMDKYTALFKNVLSYPYAGWGDSVSRTKKNSKNILKVGNMMGNKKISLGKKSQQTDEILDYICYILKWINIP
jgi:hypothetical protein